MTEAVSDWGDRLRHLRSVLRRRTPTPSGTTCGSGAPSAHSDRLRGSWLPHPHGRRDRESPGTSPTSAPGRSSWSRRTATATSCRPARRRSSPTRRCQHVDPPAPAPLGSRTPASATYEPYTRVLCNRLIDGFVDRGSADAAADYAQQIPVRVIGRILGVPDEMSDTFTGWVRSILEFANDEERRIAARDEAITYFWGEMEARRGGRRRRPDQHAAARRGRRRAGERRVHPGHGRPHPDRRGGHHLVGAGLLPSGTWPPTPRTGRDSPPTPRFCPWPSRNSCGPTRRSPWPGSWPTTWSSPGARCGRATAC